MQRVVARQMQNWHTFSLHEKARRRDDAACRSRTSIASYGKLQTQIFFTQRPSQAPADSRVPTSGAVLQVPQRHLSNWKRTTKIPNCRALGVRCLGVSVLVCLSWCVRVNVCVFVLFVLSPLGRKSMVDKRMPTKPFARQTSMPAARVDS